MTAKKTTKAATTKKPTKVKAPAKKKLSAMDAAALVLAENGGPMSTKELVEAMAQKKLWESPNGKTPAVTLYAAVLREITTKGKDSRFKKTEPGRFAATGAASKADAEEATPAPPTKAAKPRAAKGDKKRAGGKKAAPPPAAEALAAEEMPAA